MYVHTRAAHAPGGGDLETIIYDRILRRYTTVVGAHPERRLYIINGFPFIVRKFDGGVFRRPKQR